MTAPKYYPLEKGDYCPIYKKCKGEECERWSNGCTDYFKTKDIETRWKKS